MSKANQQIDEILDRKNLSESQKEFFKKMIHMAKIYQGVSDDSNFSSFLENGIKEEAKK